MPPPAPGRRRSAPPPSRRRLRMRSSTFEASLEPMCCGLQPSQRLGNPPAHGVPDLRRADVVGEYPFGLLEPALEVDVAPELLLATCELLTYGAELLPKPLCFRPLHEAAVPGQLLDHVIGQVQPFAPLA